MNKKVVDPNAVFVPRSADIVKDVYISRDELEKKLLRAVKGTKNILMKGQSGCGKTWLYKKVFENEKIKCLTVDLSDAAIDGNSIESAIMKTLCKTTGEEYVETHYKQQMSGTISAVCAKADMNAEHSYEKYTSVLTETFQYLHETSKKGKKAVLVLDNLEHISDKTDVLRELNAILMKVDNSDFSKYDVKILVVGTPVGAEKFYSITQQMETIANRIDELPEVMGLQKKEEVMLFMKKTFVEKLDIEFQETDLKRYAKYIFEITSGIPQRLHEYCLQLYYVIQNEGKKTDFKIHKQADKDYMRASLTKYSKIIEKRLNSYETTDQRRNQVIYCLSKLKRMKFSTSEMETMIKKEFKIEKKIQISNILAQLAKGESPILSKNNKFWIIQDSQYQVVIKLMLRKRGTKVYQNI